MNPLEDLRDLEAPVPDPAARLRAKRAAMAEFRRLHAIEEHRPAASKWSWKSPWLGGFATAGVVVVGISLAWFAPGEATRLQPTATTADVSSPVAATAESVAEPAADAGRLAEPAPDRARSETAPAAPASLAAERAAQESQARTDAQSARSTAALAKTTATDEVSLDEVSITGTRMQQSPTTAPQPRTVVKAEAPATAITAEEMRRLGTVNVADALLQLTPQNISTYAPQVAGAAPAPAAPPAPPGAGGARAGGEAADRSEFFVGNTIANLRGLDPTFGTRTLTTVDGRRVVSSSNQADVVDLNTIPSNLLQRMDVVTGGASATYGSGTMAGVVGSMLSNGTFVPQAAQPPAVTGTFEQFEVNPVKRVADEPESTFSIDVDTASYSFARRMLNEGRLPAADSVRVEEMINYFDYAWPVPTSRQEPLRPTIAVSDSPWAKGRKLVHIGIKGYELPARSKPDANLVFLLDVSGSMNAPDRLPLAVQSMKLLLEGLKPTDTVAIVVYAGAAGQVLPPTPVRNRAVIEKALDSLRAGGSTAGAQGIQLAYQLAQQAFRDGGVNRIFLTTDGDFNVGITDRNALKSMVERERTKGINLSVLTFGEGNTRDDIAQTLAQNGNGVAAYIDTLQEARKVLVDQASASLFTIASDVKIQVEFNPATVVEYRQIGYETRALQREDFNNDNVDAGEVGSGHTITAIYEITPVGSGAQLVDERRYADGAGAAANARGRSNEYGYLKIRYKLPGEAESRLMQQPIRQDAGVPAAIRQDVAFSTAVAGFGQLLRGGKYTGALTYDDVIRQADDARGKDEFGYRAEFVQLARKARDTRSPICAAIQELDSRIIAERRQVAQLQQSFRDDTAEVLAAKARVASTEATRAAEIARLASAGITCRQPSGQPMF